MRSVAGGIDGLEVVFDDGSLVADAGLLLAGTVMHRLGLEALIDNTVRLDGRVAGSGSGRKVLSLVASMLVGGCCIDDVQRLRSGSAAAVLPFAVVAPSTAGSFLRSFTFGHERVSDSSRRDCGFFQAIAGFFKLHWWVCGGGCVVMLAVGFGGGRVVAGRLVGVRLGVLGGSGRLCRCARRGG